MLSDLSPPTFFFDEDSAQGSSPKLDDLAWDETAPLRGSKSAQVTILFFVDLECPFSAAAYRTLVNDVLKDYGERVSVRLWPTFNSKIHPWAMHAAINARCLATQSNDSFWDFTDAVQQGLDKLTLASDPFDQLDRIALEAGQKRNVDLKVLQECITAQVETPAKDAYRRALDSGLHAVPTLIIGNEHLEGAKSAQEYRAAIDKALAQTSQAHAQRDQSQRYR
jgi:protein-disulfide isomerase